MSSNDPWKTLPNLTGQTVPAANESLAYDSSRFFPGAASGLTDATSGRILNVPRAMVWLTANVVPGSGVPSGVAWGGVSYDTDNLWSATTLPQRFTVRTPGLYMVVYHIDWDSSIVGFRQIVWFKNSVSFSQDVVCPPQVAATTNMTATRHISMNVGDAVEIQVAQTSGAPLGYLGGAAMAINVSYASICLISTFGSDAS